jgi:hypothetical protein
MFPVLGFLFGIAWLVMAFFYKALPHGAILIINSIVVFVFGLFLLLLGRTAMIGLYFAAMAAISVAVARGGSKKGAGVAAGLGGLGFFILTGIVDFINPGPDMFEALGSYVVGCETDLGITLWKSLHPDRPYHNLDTRCENYLLFLEFCIYVLILLMPVHVLAGLGLCSGGGKGGGKHSGGGETNAGL